MEKSGYPDGLMLLAFCLQGIHPAVHWHCRRWCEVRGAQLGAKCADGGAVQTPRRRRARADSACALAVATCTAPGAVCGRLSWLACKPGRSTKRLSATGARGISLQQTRTAPSLFSATVARWPVLGTLLDWFDLEAQRKNVGEARFSLALSPGLDPGRFG
ncbi:hypothetical protein BKA63DRAFT_168023 [Paraphoma chrysanthemicola]|nr:hypothetical protein BKA63DRAFT_168023 [Paraphoma chrysanthemicola]